MTMRQSTRRKTERVQGVALPTVMVMLFLCSVLALAAWRDIWLSEHRLQARADIIRSQWLANTLLHGALDDVLQRNAVTSNTSNHAGSLRHDMDAAEQNHVFFPKNAEQLQVLRQRLGTRICHDGICAPDQPLSPPSDGAKPLSSVIEYWQRLVPSAMSPATNDTLAPTGDAHYWVEIFLKKDNANTPALVYRITAMVAGLKSAKPLAVQAIWVPHESTPRLSGQAKAGQWLSWTVLHD